MVGERSSDVNIPPELKCEILRKLPAKSIVRFQCVSKLWNSIIREYIVKDSIVTRSLAEQPRDPHFIFDKEHWPSWPGQKPTSSFAYSHYQTTNEEKKLVSLEETFGVSYNSSKFQYVRGLIGYKAFSPYCYQPFTIHNPTTRQSISLPNTVHNSSFLFGCDTLNNQYKVVCLPPKYSEKMSCEVYTLGYFENQWRKISCGIELHYPDQPVVCINGVIYYKAKMTTSANYVLVSFDVRFERFNHVQTPEKLSTNTIIVVYQGKLGFICRNNLDIYLWVLENTEWSKITYVDVLRDLPSSVTFAGITHPGDEMVFLSHQTHFPKVSRVIVYYYDTKLKTRRRVIIKTTMPSQVFISIFNVVTDHVENIMRLC